MCRPILFLLFSFVLVGPPRTEARAAQEDSTATVRSFTDSVAMRTPAPGALQAYRDDPAFQYEEAARAGTSWWERVRRWLWETFFEPMMGPLGAWHRPLLYVLLGAALLFALVQFVRMRAGGGWKSPGQAVTASFADIEENLHAVDLDALVKAAAQEGDHRRAVRLLYLQVLRALADAGYIDWDPAKTNRAYVEELAGHAASCEATRSESGADEASVEEMAALTRLFERIWYGHADVTADMYRRLRPRFDRFRRRVAGRRREEGHSERKSPLRA